LSALLITSVRKRFLNLQVLEKNFFPMAKSAKKRGVNQRSVKRVSADRAIVGMRNFQLINKLSNED
jgi:hypothetical protein